MYTLYVKTGCPFCDQVLKVVEEQNIDVTLKNTINDGAVDEAVVEELIAHGGKRQVPYLIDEEKGVAMYESSDIISYLVAQKSGDVHIDEQNGESDQSGGSDEG